MTSRCRVTFFDTHHHMARTAEVEADSPIAAAAAGLKRMRTRDLLPTDFSEEVTVEIVTTTAHALKLSAVIRQIENE